MPRTPQAFPDALTPRQLHQVLRRLRGQDTTEMPPVQQVYDILKDYARMYNKLRRMGGV